MAKVDIDDHTDLAIEYGVSGSCWHYWLILQMLVRKCDLLSSLPWSNSWSKMVGFVKAGTPLHSLQQPSHIRSRITRRKEGWILFWNSPFDCHCGYWPLLLSTGIGGAHGNCHARRRHHRPVCGNQRWWGAGLVCQQARWTMNMSITSLWSNPLWPHCCLAWSSALHGHVEPVKTTNNPPTTWPQSHKTTIPPDKQAHAHTHP